MYMASPPCLEFALIVGCIFASQMISCPCWEQDVKMHESQVHSINNLNRALLPPSPLFSPFPSLHSHSFVYVCVKEINEFSDAAANSLLKVHLRVFSVPSQLCDKLPSLELIVTFSGSVYSISSLYWFTSEPLRQSQTFLSSQELATRQKHQSVEPTGRSGASMLVSNTHI